jgi:uncharacterized membrane protein
VRLRRSAPTTSSAEPIAAASTAPGTAEAEPILASSAARLLLVAAMETYIFLFAKWTVRNHLAYGTAGFDLGIFDQGVWLLSRFKAPFITVMGTHLFGDHTSFILMLVVPFYWIWPSANVLLVAQCAALGLAAIPAFLLGRWVLRNEWLALCVAVAYLLQPAVAFTNLEQFHPDSFEVPLVLLALYFMARGRWKLFVGCVIALLLVKEDVALFTLPLGVYVAVRHNLRVGALTVGLSLAYFVLAIWVILPGLNQVGTLDAWRIPFGGFGELLKATFTRPWDVVALALGPGRPLYLAQLLLPLALLPLGSPLVLTAAGPLLSNLLSTFSYQHQIGYHYSTLVVPVLVASAVFTVGRAPRGWIRATLAVVLVVASLWGAYYWGPSPWSRVPAPMAKVPYPPAEELRAATALIPPDASVAAFYRFVPHLTHRERIYDFPTPWRAANWGDYRYEGQRLPEADQVDYVVLSPRVGELSTADWIQTLANEGFVTIYQSPGLLLLKRGPTPAPTTP